MSGFEGNKRILPKQSELITINNYNKFYPQKLPSETLSSTQLKFEKSGNEVKLLLYLVIHSTSSDVYIVKKRNDVTFYL